MTFTCGLYYKHVMIVNYNSSVISKYNFKLIDDPRVAIYNHHRFIIQATNVKRMQNDLVNAMPGQCMCALYPHTTTSMIASGCIIRLSLPGVQINPNFPIMCLVDSNTRFGKMCFLF